MIARNLTDANLEAIAAALKRGLMKDLHLEIGKGVLSWAWKIVLAIHAWAGSDRALLAPLFAPKGG